MTISRPPASAANLLPAFDLISVPHTNIVLNDADVATLNDKTR
jgi:homoserine kinase